MTAKACSRGMKRDPFVRGCIPNVDKWELDKQHSRKHNYEFNNKYSNVTLYVHKPLHGDTWDVSLLGGRRFQREYLAGGNSRIHDADRVNAMELAKAYMLLHPMGRKDY